MTIELFLRGRLASFREFFSARFGERWTAFIARKLGFDVMNFIRDGKFPARRQKSCRLSTLVKVEQYAHSLGYDPKTWVAKSSSEHPVEAGKGVLTPVDGVADYQI